MSCVVSKLKTLGFFFEILQDGKKNFFKPRSSCNFELRRTFRINFFIAWVNYNKRSYVQNTPKPKILRTKNLLNPPPLKMRWINQKFSK